MENFMKHDFDISEVILACKVITPTLTHTNRASYGLAFHPHGSVCFTFDTGKVVTSRENEIVFLPKYSNYKVKIVTPPLSCYAINFNLHTDISIESFKMSLRNTSHFKKQFLLAEQVWAKKDIGFQMQCKSILYDVLVSMQNEYNIKYISSKNAELIIPAISYIHDNYHKEVISIIKLANLCNISDTYFRKIFSQVYGCSPLKYINNLKFERAKELILSGEYSIYEVSDMSGFTDVSYFSREFKKATGINPSHYFHQK